MTAGFASPPPHSNKGDKVLVTDGSHFGAKQRGQGWAPESRVLIFSLCSGYRHSSGHFSFSLSPHLLEERGTLYVSWLYHRTVVGTHKEKDTKTHPLEN